MSYIYRYIHIIYVLIYLFICICIIYIYMYNIFIYIMYPFYLLQFIAAFVSITRSDMNEHNNYVLFIL